MVDNGQQVHELEEKIREMRNSLPAHSIPAAMLLELEDLEERLLNLEVELDKKTDAST